MSRKQDDRSSQSSDVSGLVTSLSRIAIDRSGTLFTVDVLSNDLLNDAIFSCCSPKTLLRLSRVCCAALVAVRTYFHHTFDINRHLSRFFDDPIAFRAVQARTATLISGSQALQFLDRSHYSGSDLDIYVHMQWRQQVGKWLLSAGYVFAPNAGQNIDFEMAAANTQSDWESITGYEEIRGLADVFTFLKSDNSGNERKIQLMVASSTPMEIILRFHSTCVMNVITYKKAIALYPNATFEQRQALICPENGSSQMEAISKYSSRGWQMLHTLPSVQPHEGEFAERRRWLEDGQSWFLPLDMTDITSSPASSTMSAPLRDDPSVFTSWSLNAGHSVPSIKFSCLKESLHGNNWLFYDYVVDDDDRLHDIIQEMLYDEFVHEPDLQYSDALLLSNIAFIEHKSATSCGLGVYNTQDSGHWSDEGDGYDGYTGYSDYF